MSGLQPAHPRQEAEPLEHLQVAVQNYGFEGGLNGFWTLYGNRSRDRRGLRDRSGRPERGHADGNGLESGLGHGLQVQ